MHRQHVVYCHQHSDERDELLHQAHFKGGFAHQQAGIQVDSNLAGVSAMHRCRKDARMYAHAALDSSVAGPWPFLCFVECSIGSPHDRSVEEFLDFVVWWQDADKHRRLKIIMSDRPDLINSEMGGVAFSSIDQCFKQNDLKRMFNVTIQISICSATPFFVTVDPAAGGENSDFAVVSFTVAHGLYKVLLLIHDSMLRDNH
jgi:hypothetical protein